MKTLRALIAALALACAPALAADVTVLNENSVQVLGYPYPLIASRSVNATATVTSSAIDLSRALYFGAYYQCVSAAGTPNVDIAWQESPTKEETDFVDTSPLVADDHTSESKTLKSIAPPPMRYGRIQVRGNAGNPADSICSVTVLMQGHP